MLFDVRFEYSGETEGFAQSALYDVLYTLLHLSYAARDRVHQHRNWPVDRGNPENGSLKTRLLNVFCWSYIYILTILFLYFV